MCGLPTWYGPALVTGTIPGDHTGDPGTRPGTGPPAGTMAGTPRSPGLLTLRGAEAAGGAGFTRELPPVVPAGSYPSVISVPGAGCWTLTVAVGGRTVGSITVPAG